MTSPNRKHPHAARRPSACAPGTLAPTLGCRTATKAINGWDVLDVLHDALAEPQEYKLPRPVLIALIQAVERREFPSPDVLAHVVARACFLATEKNTKNSRVRNAAWRISDALNQGVRVTYQPRPVRSDGTTD